MGQDLELRTASGRYEYRISRSDWSLIQALRAKLPSEIESLFEVPSLGEEVRVGAETLRRAVARLQSFLEEHPEEVPWTFQYKLARPLFPGLPAPGFAAAGMSGIQLPGEPNKYYYLRAGVGECFLEEVLSEPDASPVRRDLRTEKQLETSNLGTIHLRRTKSKSELRAAIRDIGKFLARISEPDVIKSVS